MDSIEETNTLLSNNIEMQKEDKMEEEKQIEEEKQEQKEQQSQMKEEENIVEKEQKEEQRQMQKEDKMEEEKKQEVEEPLLMKLIELEINDSKVEFPATIISLEYMLKSSMLFKDNNERNSFFKCLQESFSKFVQDNHIDVKDIPELLKLANIVYEKFNKNLANNDKINNYDLTISFLLTAMRVYLSMTHNKDNDILHLFDKILCSAVELLKTQEVVHKKDWFPNSLFWLCKQI